MSFDHLFEEILVTEQKALEKRQFLQSVKSEIIRCNEKLRDVTEYLHKNKNMLESKVKDLSEELFHLDLLKKREEGLKKQREEMAKENNIYLEALEEKKRKNTEERDRFVREISEFNATYDLLSNRIITIEVNAKSEIFDLETEAKCLKNGLEDEVTTAVFNSKLLEAERLKVCQKPQTDDEFLRLKKELELHKVDDLESVYETLRTEIQFLQLKLSQDNNHPQNNKFQIS
ncbi:coiled-coil domain-containing protein 172 [Pristis pectinata]|uniref:coiled-coil domain-containing protein 172 n=1 Tax=Pristis pectinata TaxID=685728 RepID=UPI00223CE7F3|nr:coiled-coil domain-containing protein 172 [Pristis pectinata]